MAKAGEVTTAWELIGESGEFRIAGGRAVYEYVHYEDRQRGRLVKLERVEAAMIGRGGLRVVTRYVDGDTQIEVLSLEGVSQHGRG